MALTLKRILTLDVANEEIDALRTAISSIVSRFEIQESKTITAKHNHVLWKSQTDDALLKGQVQYLPAEPRTTGGLHRYSLGLPRAWHNLL